MPRILFIISICAFECLLSLDSLGQQTDFRKQPGNAVSKKKFRRKANAPKQKRISLIVKNTTKGVLYGNACMTENTHRMGFEYSIQVPGLPGSLTTWERTTDNMWVHLRLIFTKGPWWKMVLKKRVKDCRKRSGDWVG